MALLVGEFTVKVEAGVGVGVTGVGGEGEAEVLEAATALAEEVRWGEVQEVPPAVAPVDVAEVATSASGKKTSQPFTLLSSRGKRTRLSPGSTLSKMTHPNYLSVRFLPFDSSASFHPFFSRSWMGDTRKSRGSES